MEWLVSGEMGFSCVSTARFIGLSRRTISVTVSQKTTIF
jgi:hypothetical protein